MGVQGVGHVVIGVEGGKHVFRFAAHQPHLPQVCPSSPQYPTHLVMCTHVQLISNTFTSRCFLPFLLQKSSLVLAPTPGHHKAHLSTPTPGAPPVLQYPTNLTSAELLAVLKPHESSRVLVLSFAQLASHWDAFGGFSCASELAGRMCAEG